MLSVSPDSATASPMLPRIPRMAQGSGDLGRRMHRPMQTLPPGPVCIVGTDIPAIRAADVRRAFRELGRSDAVFGPAVDGGFWLVGLRRRPRLIWPYANVIWSQSDTLASVFANLNDCRIALTALHSDVDSRQDLVRLGASFGRIVPPL
jgi:glycosyltransferase A (GT-A) superfamily protein (DUF2064 family)